MKICFITPLFDPWNIGGAEKYINLLANSFSKNHDVIVITTKGPHPRESDIENSNLKIYELKNANVTSYYSLLKTEQNINSAKSFFWNLLDLWNISNYFQILKILKYEKPDVIHINGITGLSSSVFSAVKKLKIPHVLTLHDYELISRWGTLFRNNRPITKFNLVEKIYINLMKRISSSITSVISPSNFCINHHTNLGYFEKSKKHVIPHGTQLKKEVIPKVVCKEFIFLGRLTKQKGPHIAINAFKKVKEKDLKLHIVGDGPYMKTLKNISENDSRIVFHGYVTFNELESITKQCSFAIVPSLSYEPFGLIIHELMNRGLPVIGSNRGAIPELVIDGKNGFIFNPENPDTLTKLIENIVQDKEKFLELSTNAIKSANEYPLEKQLKMTMEVFSNIA